MRVAGAVILSVSLAVFPAALPCASVQAGTLAAGRPAGLQPAQEERSYTWLYATAGVLVFGGVAVLISNDSTSGTVLKIGNGGDQGSIVASPSTSINSTGGTR